MAIDPSATYPGQVATGDPGYPYGKARNVGTSGDGTGTPWEERLVNDWFGFFQAMLDAAKITPSGSPDEVGASQFLDAIERITNRKLALANWFPQDVSAGGASKLTGVAFSDNLRRVVAVGAPNTLLYSDHGYRWRQASTTVANPFNAVARSDARNVFLAVGDLGDFAYGSGGISWTDGTRGHGEGQNAVVDNPDAGFFVVVGDSGTIETTADGVTWVTRGSGTGITLNGVAYSSALGVAVAVGFSGTIRRSVDGGATWVGAASVPTGDAILDVTWDAVGEQFVAVTDDGGVLFSDDGDTWTQVVGPITSALSAVKADDSGIVVVASSEAEAIQVTYDGGTTWQRYGIERGASMEAIAYQADEGWIIAGDDYSSAAMLITSMRFSGR